MILGCEKDKHLIGKDETMKDYLPEQIIDILRECDFESIFKMDDDISKRLIYGTLRHGNITIDDVMDLCVDSVNCVRKITLALKGAGYEI